MCKRGCICAIHFPLCFALSTQDYELLAGSRAMNEVAMCGQLQNSITACVYFLAPHQVKKVDLILISALSQVVRDRRSIGVSVMSTMHKRPQVTGQMQMHIMCRCVDMAALVVTIALVYATYAQLTCYE